MIDKIQSNSVWTIIYRCLASDIARYGNTCAKHGSPNSLRLTFFDLLTNSADFPMAIKTQSLSNIFAGILSKILTKYKNREEIKINYQFCADFGLSSKQLTSNVVLCLLSIIVLSIVLSGLVLSRSLVVWSVCLFLCLDSNRALIQTKTNWIH